MSHRMRRRDFLVESSRVALSFSVLPLVARAQGNQISAESKDGAHGGTLIADLERLIPKLMAESIVPGLSIAIIKDAKLLWRRGFGVKDSAAKAPVDNDTVFEAASVSKTVFAYAALKLCERGVIGLDTPLTRYTAKPFLEGDPRLGLITARHVLSHTSGFQNWRSDKDPLKIHFSPGEKFSYSDPKKSDAFRLNKESLKEMVRPQVKVDDSRSWALGWQIQHTKQGDLIQHGRDNEGFHAFASASVERKSGFIIMTNGENGWKLISNPAFAEVMNRFFAG